MNGVPETINPDKEEFGIEDEHNGKNAGADIIQKGLDAGPHGVGT